MPIEFADLTPVTWMLIVLCIAITTRTFQWYLRRRSLPPGPRGYPIVGNAFQIPTKFPGSCLRFSQWRKQHGPVVSVDLFGQLVVVLNDHKSATDLLDRRSKIYSDRPRFIMGHEILADSLNLVGMRYGDTWRRLRRATHESFNVQASERFRDIQRQAAVGSALSILRHAEDWEHHIDQFAGTSVLRSVYGWPSVTASMTPVINQIREMAGILARSAVPGSHLVELIPAMKHLPTWLAKWKKEGLELCRQWTKMFQDLDAGVAESMIAGKGQECFVTQLMDGEARGELTSKESAWLAGTMFFAGSETTATTLQHFLRAMTLYPDIMRKAQTEIDTVVGRGRPPTFDDEANLPYVQALVKELLRWRPVGPIGIPHYTSEDDWYEGHLIPKGTIILANIWAMNRDPTFYPDFDEFRPERFLEKSEQLNAILTYTHGIGHVTYGFGRRVCAGMHLANQALFIIIATLLWATDIHTERDEHDSPFKESVYEWVDRGVVVAPASFPCSITPRFSEAQSVLEAVMATLG